MLQSSTENAVSLSELLCRHTTTPGVSLLHSVFQNVPEASFDAYIPTTRAHTLMSNLVIDQSWEKDIKFCVFLMQ